MVTKKISESQEVQADSQQKNLLEDRKKAFSGLFKNNVNLAAVIIVLLIASYAYSVRTSNIPNLKDVTTGNYTLGPDLDPFLFLRWAQYIVDHGELMKIDTMRYYPVGYDTSKETLLLPYSITYLYKLLHFFNKSVTVDFAAVVYPAICFFLATLAFFLFARRLFINSSALKRNLIAITSTLLFIAMPSLVHRTVAGIPEKEAAGIFLLFLSLYLFLVSLQSKSKKSAFIYGLLSGITTGMLGLVWGAITFIFLGIGLAMLLCFIFEIAKEKEYIAYLSWVLAFSLVLTFTTTKYGGFLGLVTSTTSLLVYLVAATIIFDFFLTKYVYPKFENKIKFPKKILSFVITLMIGGLIVFILDPGMVTHIFEDVKLRLLHPQGTDRIALTVAENSQPYFSSWSGTYGTPFFWIFIAAAVLLFYEAVSQLKKIERYILSFVYFIFLAALIFSRYKADHIMNGTSTLSQTVYFGGFFIFAAVFAIIYTTAQRNKESEKISKINLESVLLLSLFFWSVISARGAIRLFFLLEPIIAILAGFIVVYLPYKAFSNKDETIKVLIYIASAFVLFIVLTSFYNFAQRTRAEAAGTVPSPYTLQWQYAMKWVRENTSKDSVFVHWWDYGYWVQSIGERATVVDGGNMLGYWDHLVGRHVLTAQNETEALEFMKPHNVSYLLIDPTDIGKYPAYSSIGSDLEYDRYNWVPTMLIDEKQTQETRNGTVYVYQGGTAFDKDFLWYDSETKQQYLFPQQSQEAIIAGVLFRIDKLSFDNETFQTITQPKAVIIYQRATRIEIPLCYLYYSGQLYDFRDKGPCLPAGFYIVPKLNPSGAGVNINYIGAALYLSEKAMNALWVKLYLLNQTENFELVHSEQSYVVKQLKQQGIEVSDFVFYGDINGPIKIWKVNYPKEIKFRPEYLEVSYPDIRLLMGNG